jgi:hypothetical protein
VSAVTREGVSRLLGALESDLARRRDQSGGTSDR